jgi:hypothetical protein
LSEPLVSTGLVLPIVPSVVPVWVTSGLVRVLPAAVETVPSTGLTAVPKPVDVLPSTELVVVPGVVDVDPTNCPTLLPTWVALLPTCPTRLLAGFTDRVTTFDT